MKHCAAALCLAAGLAVGAVPVLQAAQVGSFHRQLTVSGPVVLYVGTGSGSIHVTGTPGSAVTIDATISDNGGFWFNSPDPKLIRQIEDHPPIEQSGNTIRIERPHDSWFEHLSISYLITTPPDTELHANAGSGAVEAGGLKGNADLQTGSGHIRVEDINGSVRAGTGSGGIEFGQITGDARLTTGSGSIRGGSIGGHVYASTGSGHISMNGIGQGGEVHTASGGMDLDGVNGDLNAHSSSGGVRVGGTLGGQNQWRIGAASGSIEITLPQSTFTEARLDTASGSIHVGLPQRDSQIGRHSWSGVIGSRSGSPTAMLVASAASGSITVN